jgi:hypothetical protein
LLGIKLSQGKTPLKIVRQKFGALRGIKETPKAIAVGMEGGDNTAARNHVQAYGPVTMLPQLPPFKIR